MYHPFQRIATVGQEGAVLLLAAAGPNLLSINVQDGTITSKWSSATSNNVLKIEDVQNGENTQDHPQKRRKVELPQPVANIIQIAPTSDGRHAVIVTAEDKCVHVFAISADGLLQQLSRRCMSKRPSALTLIDQGRTIVVADKFGDVYALPLLPTEEQESAAKEAARQNAKPLRIKASETTVHSKANLKSLEYQRKQAEENAPVKTKESMNFTHEYLLGHISMITDIVATDIPLGPTSEVTRTHLLTSDRDEHIRISRGPPQCCIIERYLLGHKEYISKMCLVAPDILISGGGQDDLLVWRISDGSLLAHIPFMAAISQAGSPMRADSRLAVSGLWSYAVAGCPDMLLIGLEGQPFLLCCELLVTQSVKISDVKHLSLPANLLDLAIIDELVVVSLDNIHSPGSIDEVDTAARELQRLQVVNIHHAPVEACTKLQARLVEANETMIAEWHEKDLQTLLYSVANLRKVQGDPAEAEVAETEAI